MKHLMWFASAVSAALFAFVAAMTFVDVVGRYVFSKTIPGGYDLAQQLQAVVIFWGIALTTNSRSHINVDLVWEKLSPRNQRRLERAADVFNMLAFAILFFCAALQLPKAYRSGEIIPDMGIPVWIFASVAVAGLGFAMLGAAAERPNDASATSDRRSTEA